MRATASAREARCGEFLIGRSYALGGGGSGDLVTDRSSFAKRNGLSRSKDDAGAMVFTATPIPLGAHEAISEQAPGASGNEQSDRCESPSRSWEPCIGIPGMSGISAADVCEEPVDSHA
jgi:hypothetical protein